MSFRSELPLVTPIVAGSVAYFVIGDGFGFSYISIPVSDSAGDAMSRPNLLEARRCIFTTLSSTWLWQQEQPQIPLPQQRHFCFRQQHGANKMQPHSQQGLRKHIHTKNAINCGGSGIFMPNWPKNIVAMPAKEEAPKPNDAGRSIITGLSHALPSHSDTHLQVASAKQSPCWEQKYPSLSRGQSACEQSAPIRLALQVHWLLISLHEPAPEHEFGHPNWHSLP